MFRHSQTTSSKQMRPKISKRADMATFERITITVSLTVTSSVFYDHTKAYCKKHRCALASKTFCEIFVAPPRPACRDGGLAHGVPLDGLLPSKSRSTGIVVRKIWILNPGDCDGPGPCPLQLPEYCDFRILDHDVLSYTRDPGFRALYPRISWITCLKS